MHHSVGHNSVQIPHDGRFVSFTSTPEGVWRRAEYSQARRERLRLIRNGTITPAHSMPPQLLVRNPSAKGGWSPEIKTY